MPGDKTPRKLIWPAGLRVTVLRRQWFDRFSALPPGLSLKQIEERLGESYASVALWAKCFGYPATKLPRGRKSLTNWDAVDWSKKNCDIARELNVSGERVRQIREARHLPTTQRLSDAGQRFRQYIAANRRRLQKWSIRQIIVQSGANISTATAHTILKQSKVRLRQHFIPWKQVNWQLPDREIAEVWRTNPTYVRKNREQLDGGTAQWDGDIVGNQLDPVFRRLLARELKLAQTWRRRS